MELNKLYDVANKENISVVDFKMKNKAIICKVDKEYHIGLNYSKISNLTEEKELLAEELGHYYYNAFYNVDSNPSTISQKEYRANKWKCTVLVSVNDLKEAFKNGLKNLYEVADYLNLSEDTVAFAYNYYKENSYI
ncbi:MAG: hypothetical protein J6A89_03945 [Clostridia bacterium]|nr:hypothetical protein [Clostridia bacterium]